jgi:hypothetical protein
MTAAIQSEGQCVARCTAKGSLRGRGRVCGGRALYGSRSHPLCFNHQRTFDLWWSERQTLSFEFALSQWLEARPR